MRGSSQFLLERDRCELVDAYILSARLLTRFFTDTVTSDLDQKYNYSSWWTATILLHARGVHNFLMNLITATLKV